MSTPRPYDRGRTGYPDGATYDPAYDPARDPGYDTAHDPAYDPAHGGYGATAQPVPDGRPSPVNAGRLWAGGAMTAVVAALAAVVCVLLVRGVLDVAIFAPEKDGAFGDASTGLLASAAVAAALVATALLHLLILTTPRPERFFTWIVALGTAAMVLLPFTFSVDTSAKIGSAAVYLVLGLAIGSLLTAVARSAVRPRAYRP